MNARSLLLLLGLGFSLVLPAQADTSGRVWVYQPDGNSYRIGSGSYRYDPRSPYPQHPQYRQNLPPRYQGQLPPQYYDRHRNLDRPQRWNGGRPNHPQHWQHEQRSGNYGWGHGPRQGRDYRPPQRRELNPQRGYRRP